MKSMEAEANIGDMVSRESIESNKSVRLFVAAFRLGAFALKFSRPTVQNLVEDFLQYLRHERGQSDNTAKTYAALLGKFVTWAEKQNLRDWKSVELKHLMSFLSHERMRGAATGRPRSHDSAPKDSSRRLSGESVYLEIAALR